MNCAFKFKRKKAARHKRKVKSMTLDTQANLPKVAKVLLYSERMFRGVEEGKGMFSSEYGDDKNYTCLSK